METTNYYIKNQNYFVLKNKVKGSKYNKDLSRNYIITSLTYKKDLPFYIFLFYYFNNIIPYISKKYINNIKEYIKNNTDCFNDFITFIVNYNDIISYTIYKSFIKEANLSESDFEDFYQKYIKDIEIQ